MEKIIPGDIQILAEIAEKKFLTPLQLSILCNRSQQTIRRRLRFLFNKGFTSIRERVFAEKAGRKGNILIISEKGLKILQKEKVLSDHALYVTDKSIGSLSIEHELLVNWVLISVNEIQEVKDQFKVLFLTTSSHVLKSGSPERPFISEKFFKIASPDQNFMLLPDGVFMISDKNTGKTLLFFLEVDMGTETIVSPSNQSGDLFYKITKYKNLFEHQNFDKYNKFFNYEIKGFRLLFVTSTKSRMLSVSNFVQEIQPSDFIWVTSKSDVLSKGIAAKIWARGGILNKNPESILGEKYTFGSPLAP
jgi:hypothetical protein